MRPWRRRGFPPRGPHRYELHVDGGTFIPAMLGAIETAREQVLLEMYLVASGATAEHFIDALAAAARRGVDVHLLLDGFGTQGLGSAERAHLSAAGVQLTFYNPLGWVRWRVALFRDHRKLLLVDGRLAFVGGMGITDAFDPATRGAGAHWHEVMLALEGPCVADWHSLFADCWRQWSRDAIALPASLASPAATIPDGQVLGHVRAGGQAVMRAVLAQIGKAHTRVWIATAYFAPTRRLRRALKRAVRRGVDVRLLLAGPCNDHPAVWHAGRRFYGPLLQAGVRIFEYQPRFLHAKMVLCDEWASIGSSNLDHWTLRWNLEANQAVTGPVFAEDLAAVFRHDFTLSEEWTFAAWQQRGLRLRLLERVLGSLDDLLVQWSYRRALRHPPSVQG
ncbi:Cardiolipin synthetase [Thioalkalivibrio nitratireducens DSM 14787]|uniref:Cardiolipin synthetase n=1 Tax=Thioalkalivibrio nitratireducens (strain DSM 14787 / UNIQEM 213 / ALEN2) TaxID=1255043 RepID=L0E147_THIND|nr:phospholipase D-like domain-containing protein [Thioalkalivibrio nitratireducens]AGA35023.1 Cardiolipin synthetase [Thioalkalivibrio nitratireducens DSM 14787]